MTTATKRTTQAQPWTFIRGPLFICDRCGAEERVSLPVPVRVFLFWCRDFQGRHRGCKVAAK